MTGRVFRLALSLLVTSPPARAFGPSGGAVFEGKLYVFGGWDGTAWRRPTARASSSPEAPPRRSAPGARHRASPKGASTPASTLVGAKNTLSEVSKYAAEWLPRRVSQDSRAHFFCSGHGSLSCLRTPDGKIRLY